MTNHIQSSFHWHQREEDFVRMWLKQKNWKWHDNPRRYVLGRIDSLAIYNFIRVQCNIQIHGHSSDSAECMSKISCSTLLLPKWSAKTNSGWTRLGHRWVQRSQLSSQASRPGRSMTHCWLVVDLPLWNIWKSIGMMKFLIYGQNNNVPNHQPDCIALSLKHTFFIQSIFNLNVS